MANHECFASFEVLFTASLLLLSVGTADRIREKIYIDLQSDAACFRRLNATHQVGCSSQRGGSVGVLLVVETIDNLQETLQNGPFYPYAIALPYQFFNSSILHLIRDSGKANGVIVLFPDKKPISPRYEFSPDKHCPNAFYGMYRGDLADKECKVTWNPYGENIMFEDWNFPIFSIRRESDIDHLKECYRKFNSPESLKADKWPLCSAELQSYMLGAKDAKTCIRRSYLHTNIHPIGFCDPLGDHNIWMTLKSLNKSSPVQNGSLIVIAARLDAASLFDSLSPGVDSAVTGVVTLLAVADALAKFKDKSNYLKNIMFVIFNGESFDYIGSSRMVYDMEKNNFPSPLDDNLVNQSALVNLNSIGYFIELNQLSHLSQNGDVFIHFDSIVAQSQPIKLRKMINILKKQGDNFNLAIRNSTVFTLPSSSLQSFLRKNKNIPGIVLTDHDEAYTNRFYNSMFDIGSVLKNSSNSTELFEHLAKVASAVAQTVHNLASNSTQAFMTKVNSTFIEDMFTCYVDKSACQLFLESSDPAEVSKIKEQDGVYSLYVSVDKYSNYITKRTLQLLAYLTGELLPNVAKADCHSNKEEQIIRYLWVQGSNANESGICLKTVANYSKAVSPAFEIDGYDFDSGEYSTWTESVWEDSSVRIFLKPSKKWEMLVLFLGMIIFVISFFMVWFINRRSGILFANSQMVF